MWHLFIVVASPCCSSGCAERVISCVWLLGVSLRLFFSIVVQGGVEVGPFPLSGWGVGCISPSFYWVFLVAYCVSCKFFLSSLCDLLGISHVMFVFAGAIFFPYGFPSLYVAVIFPFAEFFRYIRFFSSGPRSLCRLRKMARYKSTGWISMYLAV